jgi:hypothetical protein
MILLQKMFVFVFARRRRRALNYPQLLKVSPAQKTVHAEVLSERFLQGDLHNPESEVD